MQGKRIRGESRRATIKGAFTGRRDLWVWQMQRMMRLGAELCGIGQLCKAEVEGGRWGILESVVARLLCSLTHWSMTPPGWTPSTHLPHTYVRAYLAVTFSLSRSTPAPLLSHYFT